MKTNIIIVALLITVSSAFAQNKIDTERMDRDIEIAENALATIIKQKYEKRSMWLEVKANYTPGFGVTMRLPNENSNWIYEHSVNGGNGTAVLAPPVAGGGTRIGGPVIVYSARGGNEDEDDDENVNTKDSSKSKDKEKKRADSRDSARNAYYTTMIQASKEFITDYGDLISQLQPDEKILITNRGDGGRYYYDWGNRSQKRQLVTIEGAKSDILLLRQGKITREQMLQKIKVVNTETTNEKETDLELFSSIISRLYRSDLARTFYTDENIYYERLKDFGTIYYMSAYSSSEQSRSMKESTGKIWAMPTQRLEGLTQEQRDKKVIELYPQFEKELKENIVEYAQTIKSMKDEEMIVFNVQITKCVGCNIPANLELSLKMAQVRKLAAGQATKAEVVNAISVKKGVAQ